MTQAVIDKPAYIYLKNRQVLVTRSKGKDVWYIPGGKREMGESDQEALTREVKEELSVDLIRETIQPFEVFQAQAHGRAAGVVVQMSCYFAQFEGELKPAAEIAELDFFNYHQVD